MVKQHWSDEGEGRFSEASMRRRLVRQGYDVTRCTYPPGTQFSNHKHQFEKVEAVVRGRFRMIIEGREVILRPGEWVEVPEGAVHSAEVLGDRAVVCLDARDL